MYIVVFRSVSRSMFMVALLVLLGGMSCAEQEPTSSPPRPSLPCDATGHWVQDEKVRALMQQIARGTASWPQGVPDDPELEVSPDLGRAFADAAVLADELAHAASQIPDVIIERPMTTDARERFIGEARSLHREALELKDAARGQRVERTQRSLARINTTCFACHSEFRDLTGEMHRADLNESGQPVGLFSLKD
jgi:hypothetical protein